MATRWNKRNVTIKMEEMEETTLERNSDEYYIQVRNKGRKKLQGTIQGRLTSGDWDESADPTFDSPLFTIIFSVEAAEIIGADWDESADPTLERSWS
jgi:hypothetical protein